MSAATGAPAAIRTVPYTGNRRLHTDEGPSVNGSSCLAPLPSQQVSFSEAGLFRITFTAYGASEVSARIASSHALWAMRAIRARFGSAGPLSGISQFTSFAVVPLAFWSRSRNANVRIRGTARSGAVPLALRYGLTDLTGLVPFP